MTDNKQTAKKGADLLTKVDILTTNQNRLKTLCIKVIRLKEHNKQLKFPNDLGKNKRGVMWADMVAGDAAASAQPGICGGSLYSIYTNAACLPLAVHPA